MKKLYFIPAVIAVFALAGFFILMPDEGQQNLEDNTRTNTSETRQQAETQQEAESQQPVENEVFIQDFDFSPEVLRIKKGTTVTWTNKDGARHDVMPDQPSEIFKASKLLARGESYSVTFTETGTFTYYCSPHPYMKATIEVTE